MKKVVVSIANGLLAEAVTQMLTYSGEFQPVSVGIGTRREDVVKQCEMLEGEMFLAEVSYAHGTTVKTRLAEAQRLREAMPQCQIVLLCDENSAPDIAHEVMLAKRDGRIDAFFYSSVTSKYLLAALMAL